MPRSPVRNATIPAVAAAAVLAALAGCSTGSSPKWAVNTTPTPPEAQLEPLQTQTAQAKPKGEAFFDPFAAEANAESRAGVVSTIAAAPRRSISANTPGVSVYGDVTGAPSSSAPYDGAENLAQVSFAAEGADFDPDVSRDGAWIVYASTQHRPTPDIYLKSTTGRAVTQLTQEPSSDVQPSFSPDSKRIAFASDRAGSWDIYVMSASGGQPVQITDDVAQELHPSWSPDGSMLAYCRLGTTSGRWEIWVVEVNNPAVKRFLGYGLFPEWNPVDNRILFQRSRERGDRMFSVWTMEYSNGEGANPTEIVSSPIAAAVNPTWSPDGQRIAFATIPAPLNEMGTRPEGADLWIVNSDGSGRANLTGGRYLNLMPAWSSDGRIYFISDRSGKDNIWSLLPDRAIVAAGGQPQSNFATVPDVDSDGPGSRR